VFIEKGQDPIFRQVAPQKSYTPDCFEYVYFARPDSCIDGISVYRSRQNMGVKLADKIRKVLGDKAIEEIDAVIPVPETSNIAAASLASKLEKPYVTALIKNRYVHRTFILPNQALRQKSVRRKLSPIESEFRGKNLIIVDDSLVRGTTSREIVQMARDAGAARYGIDLADPADADLLAHGRTNREIADFIAADEVIFQDLEDLEVACLEAAEDEKNPVKDFEVGVFCGKYVTDVPEGYFQHLSDLRNGKKGKDNGVINIAAGDEGTLISSSGPTNGPLSHAKAMQNGDSKNADYCEDISLFNAAGEEEGHDK
ncbi:hypothetical protein Golomagni_07375, partial [Golovinomyces magnicellulatus]